MKKKKENKIRTIILLIVIGILFVVGIYELKNNFEKMNRAAGYAGKILNLYTQK